MPCIFVNFIFSLLYAPSLCEDRLDVTVRKRVENALSFPAELDKTHLLQDPKLVGDRRLSHSEKTCNIAHT